MLQFLFTQTPLANLSRNFWRDEAYSYLLAEKPLGEILTLTARDFNPPLYYLMLHFWQMVAGKSEIYLRLASFVPYLGMILVALALIPHLAKRKGLHQLLYLLVFALTPIFLYYAFELRMYSLLAFFTLLSSYAFLTKKKKLYLVATVGGLYTHYFMLLVVFTQFVFLYISHRKKFSLREFTYPLLALFAFLPWVLFVLTQKNPIDDSFWISAPVAKDYFKLWGELYTGYEKGYTYYPAIMLSSIVLLASCIGGLIFLRKGTLKKDPSFYYFAFLALIPVASIAVVSLVRPLLLTRYLIVSSVGLVFFLLMVADRLPKLVGLFFLGLLLFISLHYMRVEVRHRTKTNPAKVIKEVRTVAKPDDLLYVVNELDYFPAQFYFGKENVFIYKKNYDEIPGFVGKVLIPRERVVTTLPYYPRKAFVLDYNSSYRIEALY